MAYFSPCTVRVHVLIAVARDRADAGELFFGMRHSRKNGFTAELPPFNHFGSGQPAPPFYFPVCKSDSTEYPLLPIIAGGLAVYADSVDHFLSYILAQVKLEIGIVPRTISAGFSHLFRLRLFG